MRDTLYPENGFQAAMLGNVAGVFDPISGGGAWGNVDIEGSALSEILKRHPDGRLKYHARTVSLRYILTWAHYYVAEEEAKGEDIPYDTVDRETARKAVIKWAAHAIVCWMNSQKVEFWRNCAEAGRKWACRKRSAR